MVLLVMDEEFNATVKQLNSVDELSKERQYDSNIKKNGSRCASGPAI